MQYFATTTPEDDTEDDITPSDWKPGDVDVAPDGGHLITSTRSTPAEATMVALGQAAWHARQLGKTFRGTIIVYMTTGNPFVDCGTYEVVIKPLD
jgi:hypothetical protein